MTVERDVEREQTARRIPQEDAVVVVRRALERAAGGHPLFKGEDAEVQRALRVLEERVRRLRARGPEFREIDLSVYARKLLPGSGRIPLAS